MYIDVSRKIVYNNYIKISILLGRPYGKKNMDRLSWCKDELERFQMGIANNPKYMKEYALSVIIGQMLEYLHRKEEKEKTEE